MARRSNIMGGLKLLEKYDTGDSFEFVRPGHDQLWAGPDASDVSPEDRAELERLGWFIHEDAWSIYT